MDVSNHRHSLFGQSSFENVKLVGWVSFPERLLPVGVPLCKKKKSSWRAGRSHSTLPSSRVLTFCCPLHVISTVYFSFVLRLFLDCRSARDKFSSCFQGEENVSHELSVPGIGPPFFFESVVVSRFTFLNTILNVQRQQWL